LEPLCSPGNKKDRAKNGEEYYLIRLMSNNAAQRHAVADSQGENQ